MTQAATKNLWVNGRMDGQIPSDPMVSFADISISKKMS